MFSPMSSTGGPIFYHGVLVDIFYSVCDALLLYYEPIVASFKSAVNGILLIDLLPAGVVVVV